MHGGRGILDGSENQLPNMGTGFLPQFKEDSKIILTSHGKTRFESLQFSTRNIPYFFLSFFPLPHTFLYQTFCCQVKETYEYTPFMLTITHLAREWHKTSVQLVADKKQNPTSQLAK